MQLNTYLIFNGNCEAAFRFYQSQFGGELTLLRYSETPTGEEVAADHRDKIIHACLMVNGQSLMGSDTTPCHPHEGMKGVSVNIGLDSVEEAQRLFDALSADGQVAMPLTETFWAKRFAMFTDRFGVAWMINCSQQKQARAS